jgi:arylsulfate sulfotransferase
MKSFNSLSLLLLVLLVFLCAPANAAVSIASFTPSRQSPQPIGKTISWTATATDTGAGPLTFQFNVLAPNATQFALVKDFNVGTLNAGIWTSQTFVWVPTGVEGSYQIQVVIKDFKSGESSTKTVTFRVTTIVSSSPVIVKTANSLVDLFSVPSCPAGSTIRAIFQPISGASRPLTVTNWVGCHPPASVTFEIAGMYPSTPYTVYAQVNTNGSIKSGTSISFNTGVLPTTIPFPTFTLKVPNSGPPTDTSEPVLLHNMIQFGLGTVYPDVATDLSGNIIWYYWAPDLSQGDVLVRPLQGGGFITMQDDVSWDPIVTKEQVLRQIDLAGNIVRETNMGIIQQQLLARGAANGGPCSAFPIPAPVGAGCTGAFHHDAIQTLPYGFTAVLLDVEKIFPPGTQGDTSGLPVDIIGDMIVVLDTNWQVRWYWDAFDEAQGGNGYTKLPVSRPAVLAETCGTATSGCPPIFLLNPGIAPVAHDWLHANTLYYWPNNGASKSTPGDIIWSSRHQDWLFKIDYKDGKGTGNILWRMGPSGDFTFTNTYNDPWPWFSHQHDAGLENGGKGPLTIFDNGNTRVSLPNLSTGGIPGLGGNCNPNDCHSRGMALTFDEAAMTTSVAVNGVSADLGAFSAAMGSAQSLSNGNFFFENPIVLVNLTTINGNSMEIGPLPVVGPANVILNVAGPEHYRGWQMVSLYFPPTT